MDATSTKLGWTTYMPPFQKWPPVKWNFVFAHYSTSGIDRDKILVSKPIFLTGRGLLSVNVLLAMLITVTVFFKVIEQRFLCYRLKYIRNCFIISIMYILSLKVHCLSEANLGVPLYFPPPVSCLQHISNWQHHFLCSRRSTEHSYIGHYLYSFHAHGTRFSSLSVRTNVKGSTTNACRLICEVLVIGRWDIGVIYIQT